MAMGPRFSVKFRRAREGKTDYKKRVTLLKSNLPRLVVRKSNKQILAQVVSFDVKGDRVIAQANSAELKKLGWRHGLKNTPAAYLTGLLAGKRALEKKVPEAILDVGLYTTVRGAKVFAALKGAVDAGLKINHDTKVFPAEDRIAGKHIKRAGLPDEFEAVKQKVV